jgi:hypothetical protein
MAETRISKKPPARPEGPSFDRSPTPEASAAKADISPAACKFSEEHDLAGDLQNAIGFAEECFSSLNRLTVSVETDPECDDECLLIRCYCSGNWKDIVASQKRYIALWVKSVDATKRFKIRLTYTIE